MSEENFTPDLNSQNLTPEPEKIPDPETETVLPPKKRIVRRRLQPKKQIIEESAPEIKIEKQESKSNTEINEVLSNLYGSKDNASEIQEITVMKSSIFSRVFSILSTGVLLAAAIWVGFIFFPQKSTAESQVLLEISGPQELSLGSTSTYTINYENKSNIPLRNVILNAYFPEGFVYQNSDPKPNNVGHNEWNIESLNGYEKGQIKVTGLTYGSLNDQKSWRVFLNYTPENFNSELQKAATLSTAISNSPAKLSITGPDKASIGSDVTFTYTVQKNISWNGTLAVVPVLPPNFTITSSTPNLDKKTGQWLIPQSLATSTAPKSFTLVGKFISPSEAPSPIKGSVILPVSGGDGYQIASAEISPELLKNEVSVNLAINGAITDFDSRPGDMLNVTLRIKNQSPNEISLVAPKITFTAPSEKKTSLLKWAELVDKNENNILGEQVDDTTRRGIINWTKDNISALEKLKPNAEITIDIQLPIKNAKEFNLEKITNPLIVAVAEVKFKDPSKTTQTVGSKPINITLNSDLTFTNDDTVVNAGGTGEKHTVNWTINNNFHTLKDIRITATAFGDTQFTLIDRGAGDLQYDKDQNKITWTIPEMGGGIDVLNASFTLSLNKRNPSQSLLLSKAHLTATDSVTGKTINLAGEEISLQAN